MKNFIKILVLVLVCYSAFGQQQPYSMTQADKQKLHSLDLSKLDRAKNELMRKRNNRTLLNLMIDYGSIDAQATADSGGTQEGFRWDINAHFPDDTTYNFNLNWAAVTFDALAELDDNNQLVQYPYQTSQITIDSVAVFFLHENNTGSVDTVIVTIYEYTGQAGILVNGQDQITNNVLSQDTFYWTSSMAPVNGSGYGALIVRPDSLTLPVGERFTVGVDFYGDTSHIFAVSANYKDLCFGACGGEESIFPDNSFYRLILEQSGGSLSGVNPVILDCEDDNMITPGFCEYFYIQNIGIVAFVSADVPFSATSYNDPGPICPGESAVVGVNVIAGVEPYSYIWTENGNQVGVSQTVTVNPMATTTYDVEITDALDSTITTSMTVTVDNINIDAGADKSISCGQTANLAASIQPPIPAGTTFQWSNDGPQTLPYSNVLAGTYSITATSGIGCTATDEVKVSYPGVVQRLNFTTNIPGSKACLNIPLDFTNTSLRIGGWGFEWAFGDSVFSFADSAASHAYTRLGTFTASLKADSGLCAYSAITRKITVVDPCPVGIGEATLLDDLVDIYPNPTEGVFNIDFNDINSKEGFISVYDIRGNEIYREALTVSGSAQKFIDLEGFAQGVYLVKIQLDNEVLTKKLNISR